VIVELIKATYIGAVVTSFMRDAQNGETLILVDLHSELPFGTNKKYYKMEGVVFAVKDQVEIDEMLQQEAAAALAKTTRAGEIEAAREVSGLGGVTISQAKAYIDTTLDGATDLLTLREATRKILKKMIPYILG
jgi:hypothetical protein